MKTLLPQIPEDSVPIVLQNRITHMRRLEQKLLANEKYLEEYKTKVCKDTEEFRIQYALAKNSN